MLLCWGLSCPETTTWGRAGLCGRTRGHQGGCRVIVGRLREASLWVGSPPDRRWPSRETWLILKHEVSELEALGFIQDSAWGWENSALGPRASHPEDVPG